MLQNRHILLGISGGIAAYKCAHLVRLLIKAGAQVKVVMSSAATEFVSPKTLSVLSRNPVAIDFFDGANTWNNHVALGEWAEVFLVAPLTANTLAKMAHGQCDNLLLATYFSARGTTIVAPAMDLEMYQHVTVAKNLKLIESYGNRIIPAQFGELASGLVGEGRMAEPEDILEFLKQHFQQHLPLSGKKAFVNAGPTYEAIDPVRFIGNRSSGKMGIAIAEELMQQGAEVTLVLGPTALKPLPGIRLILVESNDEMYQASVSAFQDCDIAVCAAAVADFKVAEPSSSKIKKKDQSLQIDLVQTRDILASLGQIKKLQVLAGFALETDQLIDNAKKKLVEKKLDLIVANEASAGGGVFGSDQNKITLIDRHNKTTTFELKSKREAAKDIVAALIQLLP
jgi:phosphopantothenoylcysteine decarboxylase/phosphopantothenate--cysteine ligase